VVSRVVFSPDESTLISASERDGTVRLWQAGSAASPTAPSAPTATPAAPAAAVINAANVASLGEAVIVKNFGSPVDVALSPDGQTVAVASNFSVGIYRFGDLKTMQYELKGQQTLSRAAISPKGDVLASAGSSFDNTIWLWDLARGGLKLAELKGHTEAISGIAFSPDGSVLASVSSRDKSLHLWEVPSGKELFVDVQPQAEADGVAYSPDGATIAVGYSDKKIRLWDAQAHTVKQTLAVSSGDVGWVNSVAFSPDGKWLVATGEYDPVIHVWATDTWKPGVELHPSNPKDTHTGFYSLAFNPAGTLLASGGADNVVRLWDLDPASPTWGKELAVLQRHADWVNRVLFTPDGGTLISASERDGTIRLWRAGAGK
jgi:WD40 repeat protein